MMAITVYIWDKIIRFIWDTNKFWGLPQNDIIM